MIRRNEFAVNVLEGAISGKIGCGKTSNTVRKASVRNTEAESCIAMKKWHVTLFRRKAAIQSKG
jgi:hypothetical protein